MSQIIRAVTPPVHEIVVERHAKIRMRDGVQLDATVWRPTAAGRYPVILERTGYELMGRCAVNAEYYARRGYVCVGQNTRGSHASDGVYD